MVAQTARTLSSQLSAAAAISGKDGLVHPLKL